MALISLELGLMKKASNLEFDVTNGLFQYCNDDFLTNNHGTICADIIYNLLETDEIQFYSLKILIH